MSDVSDAPKTGMQKILATVERVGNKVPYPVMIFVYLIAFIVVLSTLLSLFGVEVSYQAYTPEAGDMGRARPRRGAC